MKMCCSPSQRTLALLFCLETMHAHRAHEGSGPLCDFQWNFVAATALNSFLNVNLVPDEVTPYRQYYLLHDANMSSKREKISISEGVEVQLQQQSAPKNCIVAPSLYTLRAYCTHCSIDPAATWYWADDACTIIIMCHTILLTSTQHSPQ